MPDEHIVKGYEVAKGRYVVVDPDELEPFIPAATKAIDLEEFVDLAEIDPVFFDTAYNVAPDKAAKPYVLLAKAMEDAGKVAIGRFVMRNKQYVAAVRPVDGRLMLSTMVFADEVVDPGHHRRARCARRRRRSTPRSWRWPSSSSSRSPATSSPSSSTTTTASRCST